MATALNKITNSYVDLLGDLYERTPKAVFAALAISALTGGTLEEPVKAVLAEWEALHLNGIVPQKPVKP